MADQDVLRVPDEIRHPLRHRRRSRPFVNRIRDLSELVPTQPVDRSKTTVGCEDPTERQWENWMIAEDPGSMLWVAGKPGSGEQHQCLSFYASPVGNEDKQTLDADFMRNFLSPEAGNILSTLYIFQNPGGTMARKRDNMPLWNVVGQFESSWAFAMDDSNTIPFNSSLWPNIVSCSYCDMTGTRKRSFKKDLRRHILISHTPEFHQNKAIRKNTRRKYQERRAGIHHPSSLTLLYDPRTLGRRPSGTPLEQQRTRTVRTPFP